MPGELGDEQTQPGVGYYEDRYDPDPEWIHAKDSTGWYEPIPENSQIKRILKRLRNKKYKRSDGDQDA